MKKVYVFITILFTSVSLYAQLATFDFESASIVGSDVVETKATVTMTASFAGGGDPGLVGYDGYAGISGKSIYNNTSSTTLTVSFNKTVTITSFWMADGGGSSGNFVVTPIPSGTTVVVTVPNSNGVAANLGSSFQNITGFTINKQDNSSTYFIVDNIVLESILPVELSSFTGISKYSDALLNWTTATEKNNLGFYLQKLNFSKKWDDVTFINGSGNSNSPKHYSYIDKNLNNGNYSYRLKQVDVDGSEHFSSEINVTISAPKVFTVNQNYPNPFNPETVISFNIPAAGNVTIKVYDITGRLVETLLNSALDAGYNKVTFNGSRLSTGTYFYRIEGNGSSENTGFSYTGKMQLIK